MKVHHILAAAAAAIALTGQAGAAVLDFDSHPADYNGTIYDSGYTFTFNASGWGVFGPASNSCCNLNYNGTTSLFADGDRSGPSSVTMVDSTGGAFSVSSFDAAVYWTGAQGSINVVGTLMGGGTVSTTLAVTTPWQHFDLSGFSNLTSLTISDSQSGSFLSAPGFGIDNINTSPVPEPSSIALMLAGLGAVGLRSLRRRQTA